MSHDKDLLKQVQDKLIGGIASTPFIYYTPSPEEQTANAKLTLEKAETEKEKRNSQIYKRWLESGCMGLILGIMATVIFFYVTKISF